MSKQWVKASLIRALKTFGQTAIASFGTSSVYDCSNVDLKATLFAAIFAFVLSILTSLAGLPEVKEKL